MTEEIISSLSFLTNNLFTKKTNYAIDIK